MRYVKYEQAFVISLLGVYSYRLATSTMAGIRVISHNPQDRGFGRGKGKILLERSFSIDIIDEAVTGIGTREEVEFVEELGTFVYDSY